MHLTLERTVVITDPYIYGCLENSSPEFMDAVETVVRAICSASSHRNSRDTDELMSRLLPWGKEIIEAVNTGTRTIGDRIQRLSDDNAKDAREGYDALKATMQDFGDIRSKLERISVVMESPARVDLSEMSRWLEGLGSKVELCEERTRRVVEGFANAASVDGLEMKQGFERINTQLSVLEKTVREGSTVQVDVSEVSRCVDHFNDRAEVHGERIQRLVESVAHSVAVEGMETKQVQETVTSLRQQMDALTSQMSCLIRFVEDRLSEDEDSREQSRSSGSSREMDPGFGAVLEAQDRAMGELSCRMDHDSKKLMDALEGFRERFDVCKSVNDSLQNSEAKLLNGIQSAIDQIAARVERMSTTRQTNRHKGEEGENSVHALLECFLPMREGYEVIETKGKARQCDFQITRSGHPNIRVEVKAHGKETAETVRSREVKRFEEDLMSLNEHGVFVSLYSNIVGRGAVEIDLLPNNRFAVYLSCCTDGALIREYVLLLYRLDAYVSGRQGVTVTVQALSRMRTYLADYSHKVNAIRGHLKNALEIANSFQTELFEKLIGGANCEEGDTIIDAVTEPDNDINTVAESDRPTVERIKRQYKKRKVPNDNAKSMTCDGCGRTFDRQNALNNHTKSCARKKQKEHEEEIEVLLSEKPETEGEISI